MLQMENNQFFYSALLKQHTPMIHFQQDQKGATLRASEVKPKLDRFLIENVYQGDKENYKGYLIGGKKARSEALDYQLRILVQKRGSNKSIGKREKEYPMFFGNMGDEYLKNPKGIVKDQVLLLQILCYHSQLLKDIKEHLGSFLVRTNFGMRQSKGYGSFFFQDSDENSYQPSSINLKSFTVEGANWKKAFEKIERFYKVLRSGINEKNRPSDKESIDGKLYVKKHDTVCYCKPVIFLYAKEIMKKQWDKKTIKQAFFDKDYVKVKGKQERFELGLKKQMEVRKEQGTREDPLFYELKDQEGRYYLIRDLLGLSSSQSWMSYGTTITKDHSKKNGGKWKKVSKKDPDFIARFKSPITLKVFEEKEEDGIKTYRVYLIPSDFPDELAGEPFMVKASGDKTKKPLVLYFPDNFSVNHFLEFLSDKEKVNIDSLFLKKDNEIYPEIKSIFEQIQSND
jgi:hypothetical protein